MKDYYVLWTTRNGQKMWDGPFTEKKAHGKAGGIHHTKVEIIAGTTLWLRQANADD